MKIHTTNYKDTFIQVAEDCTVEVAEIPQKKSDIHTIATLQFELLSKYPYQFTSDEVVFKIFAERKDLTENELPQARIDFFSKGQPCLRTSPLAKRYGWGIHHNNDEKIALFACETTDYQLFTNNESIKKVKAMKSTK